MKSIIIAGPSRSGKSTLARRISEEFGYYQISIDKLVEVFQNAYPELDIRLNWNRDKTTENIAPFIGHYLGVFSREGNFVIEGAYYDFEKIASILKTYGISDPEERFELIGLVQKDKTAEEYFRGFRKYDTEEDWTYSLNDEDLMKVAEDAVEYGEEMYRKLLAHGFRIYDTGKNREEVFDMILEELKDK